MRPLVLELYRLKLPSCWMWTLHATSLTKLMEIKITQTHKEQLWQHKRLLRILLYGFRKEVAAASSLEPAGPLFGRANTPLSQKAQSEDRRLLNLYLDILLGSIIAYPACQCLLSDHSQSLYFPFLRLVILRGLCQWQWQVCRWEESISLILRHSLMSWDSNIFARVFFTRRAVRRQAGLWAQHSDISFPICRRHWRHTSI